MLVLGKRRPVCSNDVKRIQKEVPKSRSPKWIVYLFPACWVTTGTLWDCSIYSMRDVLGALALCFSLESSCGSLSSHTVCPNLMCLAVASSWLCSAVAVLAKVMLNFHFSHPHKRAFAYHQLHVKSLKRQSRWDNHHRIRPRKKKSEDSWMFLVRFSCVFKLCCCTHLGLMWIF